MLFYSSRCYQDVPQLARNILVEWYEERCSRVHSKVCNCQKVKVEHQSPSGTLQELGIPTWMWEEVNMDFMTSLPHSLHRNDLIWIIVDRLTYLAHFLPVHTSYIAEDYAMLYI